MSKVRAEQFTNKAGNNGPNFPFGLSGIGIHSAGTAVHTGIITALNFVGAGNTFSVTGSRVDISIAGGGGGAGGESVVSGTDDLIVSVGNQAEITSNVVLQSTDDDIFMSKRRELVISSSGSVEIGNGEIMIINIFDL
tara:strand:+ start:1752 stop:2165 length:414 start_codon:yes stop_codon:yes gene_type:complete